MNVCTHIHKRFQSHTCQWIYGIDKCVRSCSNNSKPLPAVNSAQRIYFYCCMSYQLYTHTHQGLLSLLWKYYVVLGWHIEAYVILFILDDLIFAKPQNQHGKTLACCYHIVEWSNRPAGILTATHPPQISPQIDLTFITTYIYTQTDTNTHR